MRNLLLTALALIPAVLFSQGLEAFKLPHKGDIIFERTFTDKGGSNVVFASTVTDEKEMKSDIYVYHYNLVNNAPNLVWDIQDFGTPLCEMVLNEESVQNIDVDGDGYQEVSFIYQKRCDGLDPYVTKLMMFSKGQKYVIRGLVEVETGGQIERTLDPTYDKIPAGILAFMNSEWNEFIQNTTITSRKSIYAKGTGWVVVAKEDLMAGGNITFELWDAKGQPMELPQNVREGLTYAHAVDEMPDPSKLIFSSLKQGVVIYDPAAKKATTLMTFLGDTEGISLFDWSPSKKKVAFVTLNTKQYPKHTRIFVLTLDGETLAKKDKYDAAVFYMAAGDWAINYASFEGENKLKFNTKNSEGGEGPEESITIE